MLSILLLLASTLLAQHSTTRSNPFDSPMDRLEGARMFSGQCAACHGRKGEGTGAGPNLAGGVSGSDELLFRVISKGIPGTNMPAFAGNGKETWQLAAHVRSLSVGKAAERATGDAVKGLRIFGELKCTGCHSLGEQGGDSAPDLTSIGSIRSLASLRRSLTHPNEEVSPDYWKLSAKTKDGQSIEGIRMNEDTFTYQYRNGSGLKSVRKSDLATHTTVKSSPMPGVATGVEDLVAFLASLTK